MRTKGAFGSHSPRRPPTRETCVSTGTSRRPQVKSSTQAAVLRPTPGSAHRKSRALGQRRVARPVEIERLDRPQDLLDAHRLDLRDAARPDRLLDLLDRRVAHRLPRREALAQAQVGDVTVAVVGRLAEDGQHELRDGVAVGRGARHAVDLGQAGADRADAAGGQGAPTQRYPRRPLAEVEEHTDTFEDQPLFWREAEATGTPTLYVHGVPTSSDDWVEFLALTGGVAPDLPGFGRSGKRADLDYSFRGLGAWSGASPTTSGSSA